MDHSSTISIWFISVVGPMILMPIRDDIKASLPQELELWCNSSHHCTYVPVMNDNAWNIFSYNDDDNSGMVSRLTMSGKVVTYGFPQKLVGFFFSSYLPAEVGEAVFLTATSTAQTWTNILRWLFIISSYSATKITAQFEVCDLFLSCCLERELLCKIWQRLSRCDVFFYRAILMHTYGI